MVNVTWMCQGRIRNLVKIAKRTQARPILLYSEIIVNFKKNMLIYPLKVTNITEYLQIEY